MTTRKRLTVLGVVGALSAAALLAWTGRRVWPGTTLPVRVVIQCTDRSYPVQFSPDSKYLVTNSAGEGPGWGGITFWDAQTGSELSPLLRNARWGSDEALGGFQVVYGPQSSVFCFDNGSGKTSVVKIPGDEVSDAVHLPGDGNIAGGMVRLNLRESQPLVCSAQGRCYATLKPPGIAFFETATGDELFRAVGECVEFSPDESLAVVADYDPMKDVSVLTIYDLRTRQSIAAMEGQGRITAMRYSPDGQRFLSGTAGGSLPLGQVALWNSATGDRIAAIDTNYAVAEFSFSPNGRTAWAVVDSAVPFGSNYVFWTVAESGLAELPVHDLQLCAVSPDGSRLAKGVVFASGPRSFQQSIEFVTLPEQKSISRFVFAAGVFAGRLQFTSDGEFLVVEAGNPHQRNAPLVQIIQVITGSLLAVIEKHERCALAPDGRTLAMTNTTNGQIDIYHLPLAP